MAQRVGDLGEKWGDARIYPSGTLTQEYANTPRNIYLTKRGFDPKECESYWNGVDSKPNVEEALAKSGTRYRDSKPMSLSREKEIVL